MLLPMAKVQIIGTKQYQDETVRVLYGLGVVQIAEWSERRSSRSGACVTDDDTSLRQRLHLRGHEVEAGAPGRSARLPKGHLPPGYETGTTVPSIG